MTNPLAAVSARLLAVAEERDLAITTADVHALAVAAADAATAAVVLPAPSVGRVRLTNQQTCVLIGMAVGDSLDEIARRMCLSSDTARSHRQTLYRRLGVHSGPHAVAVGMSLGLLRPATLLPLPGAQDRSAV
ncbi:response regulator transcription factor [Streptomyces sp. NPDC091416]|uniref:response regulator transcription factor n=1 Tax=Streptomyces sp. NPDC091416 TaxID=3366003 RepID=UPI003830EAD2